MDKLTQIMTALSAFAFSKGTRLDSGTTAILAEQLKAIESRIYRKIYADLKGRKYVPVNNQFGKGLNRGRIGYRMWSHFGMAQAIANYADDVAMVATLSEEYFVKSKPYGLGYDYSEDDLEAAAYAGVPLTSEKADAAAMGFETLVDDVSFFGDAQYGLTGLMNNANIGLVTPDTGDWNTTATSLEILEDMTKLLQSVSLKTRGAMNVTTCLMDQATWQLLERKYMTADNTKSVLDVLRKKWPGVEFDWVPRDAMSTADAAGTGPRIAAYHKDPMVLEHFITEEYNLRAPQQRNFAFVVPGKGQTCGVVVRYPMAASYMDSYL